VKVYLVLRTRDKRQFAMKIHDFRHPMFIRPAKNLMKEIQIQHIMTGLPFLAGMTDIWFSSAKFLHLVTVSTEAGRSN
jgi:hypothetical protein